jgi:hypothetical protein
MIDGEVFRILQDPHGVGDFADAGEDLAGSDMFVHNIDENQAANSCQGMAWLC